MSGGYEGDGRSVQQHTGHRLEELSVASDRRISHRRQPPALEAAEVGTWRLEVSEPWISEWNGPMFRLFDVDPSDPHAAEVAWSRIEKSFRWSHEKVIGRAKRTGSLDHVVRIQRPSGQTRWIRFRGRRLEPGDRVLHGICQDVTGEKASESELRDACRTAEEANRAKNEFLANMSHEIRSPITAILGYCEVLGEFLPNGQSAEYLETIHRNGLHLLDLINDILDTSKIEAGEMDLCVCPVHLPTELRTVIHLMRSRAEDKNLELVIEAAGQVPETMQSDARRLRQILINLIGNAIKFTDQGRVTVRLEVDRPQQLLRLHITDTGTGISLDDQQRLFQPFTQTDASAAREQEGTGLGLCISRRLARMLGGDVSLESQPGTGSTFTVALATGPLHDVPWVDIQQSLASPASPQAIGRRMLPYRVLNIDDRRDMRRLVQRLLEKANAQVTDAGDGEQGLRIAVEAMGRGEPFDAVLIDIQMPVMDGYEATRRLRKAGYTGPIIALTAHAMQGDQQKCHDAGCSGYLSKPIEHRMLIETLERQIRRWPRNKE